MTSVLIKWANVPYNHKLFAVYHWRKPSCDACDGASTLVIHDKWDSEFDPDTAYLMTTAERDAVGYNGMGIAVDGLPHLDDGDIVLYDKRHNRLEVVFEVASETNSLYVTNACNSRCQFCPQPSSPDDGRLYGDANEIIGLVKSPGRCVNVTGGEPTLDRRNFLALLGRAGELWPETALFVLTNGRSFSDGDYVSEVFRVRGDKPIGFGIPLYADSAYVHDCVVGADGAFGQTVRGLYNLAVHKTEIEIRFVLSKLSYKRLPRLVEFIGKSIPFVTRIAVMGLEPMGYCRARWDDFWIDPEDCQSELLAAVEQADNYGVDMLMYNFQLCCLPSKLRDLARVSISEWKRTYLDRCLMCEMRNMCGGFFASQNRPEYRPKMFAL